MVKYFKMYEKDKDNFLYEGEGNGLFSGSVVAKMCGMEKSFLVSIARTQVRPYDPNRNTIVFALDYDEGVHTDSLILASKFKRNRATEFIKVYLYDDVEDTKIHVDYYQGYEVKKEKKKYYISMPMSMMCDYLCYEIDHNYIIIKDQIDKKLKKVNAKLVAITKDDNRILEIEIEPIHVESTYNGFKGVILLYTSTDENKTNYKGIKIFEVLDAAFKYETPRITNKLEEQWSWDYKPLNMSKKEAKFGDYSDFMGIVRPRSINDIWGPWTHKTPTDDEKKWEEWSHELKNYVNYAKADAEATSKLYEERRMTIKDVKKNGPATIIFWLDGDKTIVKCQPGDQDDIEKGVIMALVKGIQMRYKGYNFDGHRNWTNIFDIPYADEIDVEKVIGLAFLREWFTNPNRYDSDWHYNYVLRWVYKIKEYKFEDEVKALLALGYSKDRVKKCLKTNLGAIRDALNPPKPKKKKTKNEVEEPAPQYEVPIDGIPLPNNELLIKLPKEAIVNGEYIDHINLPDGRKLKFVASEEQAKKVIEQSNLSGKIVNMFNNGIKISQIAKELNITEYFVKKALDEITKPKSNPKKAERILNKATKEKIVHKKHVRRTQIDYPDYLDKETCDMVLERTKEKYKDHDKIQYLSELQKYFIMECKREYIVTHYGNGYDMYTIAKVLGINASSVQRIWNACKSGKET